MTATTNDPMAPAIPDLTQHDLNSLAGLIERHWPKMYFGARPYHDAMRSLGTMADNYGCDSAREIVMYFLSNATTWRGPWARAIKAELNRRLKP